MSKKFQLDPTLLIIPKRFAKANIIDIHNSGTKKLVIDFVKNFMTYYDKGLAPAFFGGPGTGKTYAAAAVTNSLREVVPIFWCDTVSQLNRLIDLRDLRRDNYFTLMKNIKQTPLVVIDDIGQLRKMDRLRELLFDLVNDRYTDNLPTIFTGNVETEKDLEIDFGSAFARRVLLMSEGLRVFSRSA